MRCTHCERPLDPYGKCKRRACPGYFPLWSGDVAAYLINNVFMGLGGACDLITVTPPGANDLPWDTALCDHSAGVPCSGARGCRVHPEALARWHADLAPRLDRLWAAARARLYRRGLKMPRYVAMMEPQARGALHLHYATHIADRTAAFALSEHLRELAPRYGFGAQVSWDPYRGQDHKTGKVHGGAGGYLAKIAGYLTKGSADELYAVLRSVPGRRIFRASANVTRETRCTMRNLRLRRAVYARTREACSPAQAEQRWAAMRAADERRQRETTFLVALDAAFRRRPPPHLERDGQCFTAEWSP